jgi:hypothetical protein
MEVRARGVDVDLVQVGRKRGGDERLIGLITGHPKLYEAHATRSKSAQHTR